MANYLRTLARPVKAELIRTLDASRLSALARSGPAGAKIVKALQSAHDPHPLIAPVEAVRRRMQADSSPLADGSLGEPMPHDAKETVAGACSLSRGQVQALFLLALAREFQSENAIELGTNVGISSAYTAGGTKRLTTMDVSVYRLRRARELHAEAGLTNVSYVQGFFEDTLQPTLAGQIFDFAFIDGNHRYQPTMDYFEAIYRHSAPTCVFVFDDISYSDEMKRAWSEIRRDPRLSVTVDFHRIGVCIKTEGATHRTKRIRSKLRADA